MKVKSVFVPTKYTQAPKLFGGKKDTSVIDGEKAAKDIENICNQLIKQGFVIKNIQPVISGEWGDVANGGWGYSYTSGYIIVAEETA